MIIQKFAPRPGASVGLAVTASMERKQVSSDVEVDLLMYNQGAKDCYIEIGGSTVTATVTTTSASGSMPIKAGDSRIIRSLGGSVYVAAICDGTDTTTLMVTPGNGS